MVHFKNMLRLVLLLCICALFTACGGKTEHDDSSDIGVAGSTSADGGAAGIDGAETCISVEGVPYECTPPGVRELVNGVGRVQQALGGTVWCNDSSASQVPPANGPVNACCYGADLCHVWSGSFYRDYAFNGIWGPFSGVKKDSPTSHWRLSANVVEAFSSRKADACACATINAPLDNSTSTSECSMSKSVHGVPVVFGVATVCGRPNQGARFWLHSKAGSTTCSYTYTTYPSEDCVGL